MRIFILTGAGVSAESGMGTFRDASGAGLWARFDPMALATPEAFARDPARVQEFYNFRRRNLLAAAPNPAHHALARLQGMLTTRNDDATLVTQNIDDLHERAGVADVIHMHGELLKARCTGCGRLQTQRADLSPLTVCPSCGRSGALRPDVVWFGETPFFMEKIQAALARADYFVSIGTSGSVYPAAGLVSQARAAGIHTCEINLAPSDNARLFDETHYGPASDAVPAWVDQVLTNTA